MFQMKFDLNPKSLKNINMLDDEVKNGLLKGIRNAMFLVESSAKKRFSTTGNLQVRTGRLRSSIRTKVTEMGSSVIGIIGSNVVYAPVHEFGNFRTPARPFLGPALEENLNTINNLIMDSIMREVK